MNCYSSGLVGPVVDRHSSFLIEIGANLELVGCLTGDEIATGGLMIPLELEEDLVRSPIGVAGWGVRLGVLTLVMLRAIF